MAPEVSSRKMKKSGFLKPRITKDTECNKDWLEYINDKTSRAVIPVGPRYQADLPDWSAQIRKDYPNESKWLGGNVLKTKYAPMTTVEEDDNTIGKGRPNFCSCSIPGSAECVKLHVRDKIIRLMSDLGPVYQEWGFHLMGEAVENSWNLNKQKKCHSRVTMPTVQSKHTSFLDLSHLPSKYRKKVVRYYFNVYVPQIISMKIRSGALEVDSDED